MAPEVTTRTVVRQALVRAAGSPARASAVQAVLDGHPGYAVPDDDDKILARFWHEDAVAADSVDRPAIRRAALSAIRAGDIRATIRALEGLPPRELAPLTKMFSRSRRKERAA